MIEQPLISIIIVCYNYAHLLPRALNAIRKQQFHDFEIVFVDNGCTDNSMDVMLEFERNNPDIRIVYVRIEKNIGLSYGDSKGVEAATGKYLMFHDADDWMDDNTLELLADAARSCDADRVIGTIRDVDENGKTLQIQELGKSPNHWLYGLVQCSLFRTSLYKSLNIKTCTNSPDMEKSFHFSAFLKRAAYVFQPCYHFLVHMDSTSRKKGIYKYLLSEDSPYSVVRLIKSCLPYVPEKASKDHTYAVYQLSRLYYGCMFHFLRDAPIKEKTRIYKSLHSSMLQLLPDYLECTKYGIKQKEIIRPYARRIAIVASTLERMHLMSFGLIGYHLVSKIHYFQQ